MHYSISILSDKVNSPSHPWTVKVTKGPHTKIETVARTFNEALAWAVSQLTDVEGT